MSQNEQAGSVFDLTGEYLFVLLRLHFPKRVQSFELLTCTDAFIDLLFGLLVGD